MKVLVTGATRNYGVAVIRALAGNGLEVIGADDRKLPVNFHSKYTKPYYLYPEPEKEGFLDAIIRIIREEKPDVVLPMVGTRQFSKYKREFERFTQLIVPEYDGFSIAFDNQMTLEECAKIGIPCPQILAESEAIAELDRNIYRSDPVWVVVKPREEFGGGYGVSFVKDTGSLIKAKKECESQYGEAVLEEFIPGNTESMRTVNLLFDRKSQLAAYFTTKKIRQWPETGGISVLSVSTNEWKLVEMVLPFFEKWRWQGPAEVELKMDSRDHKPKLIEINPRFWGYIGFPIRCGVNFPMIACELARGALAQSGVYPKYPVGIKYINPSAYIKVIVSDMISSKNKLKAIAKIITDLKGKKVTNNIQLSDPLPIIGKILFELGY